MPTGVIAALLAALAWSLNFIVPFCHRRLFDFRFCFVSVPYFRTSRIVLSRMQLKDRWQPTPCGLATGLFPRINRLSWLLSCCSRCRHICRTRNRSGFSGIGPARPRSRRQLASTHGAMESLGATALTLGSRIDSGKHR
jgi:hypothetical protein